MASQSGKTQRIDLAEKHEQIQQELERVRNEQRPSHTALSREIEAILDCVHAHLFDSDLNVNTVKYRCHIRNNNVSTRFRVALGMGIREYIEALRLKAALRLLQSRRYEIYLIAMAVGYEHQETFCRAFQRQFGSSPSCWQKD